MVAGLVDDGNPSALFAGDGPVYLVEMIVNLLMLMVAALVDDGNPFCTICRRKPSLPGRNDRQRRRVLLGVLCPFGWIQSFLCLYKQDSLTVFPAFYPLWDNYDHSSRDDFIDRRESLRQTTITTTVFQFCVGKTQSPSLIRYFYAQMTLQRL